MKNNWISNFKPFWQLLNPAQNASNLQKWPFPPKMTHFQLKFEYLSLKIEIKFSTYKFFMNVGYYPGFYSSLRDKKWRNGDILKINFKSTCIFINFTKSKKYIENVLYFLNIRHFFIFDHSESCKILDNSQPPGNHYG